MADSEPTGRYFSGAQPWDDDLTDALREGLDQLDTAEALDEQIERLSDEIKTGLSRFVEMREHLPPEYHSTFDVLVERGYGPTVKAKLGTIKQYERQKEDLRRNARNAAEEAGDA
jgi:hypothetical protein